MKRSCSFFILCICSNPLNATFDVILLVHWLVALFLQDQHGWPVGLFSRLKRRLVNRLRYIFKTESSGRKGVLIPRLDQVRLVTVRLDHIRLVHFRLDNISPRLHFAYITFRVKFA